MIVGTLLAILTLAAMFALAIRRDPLWAWAIWVAIVTLLAEVGLYAGELHLPPLAGASLAAWIPAILIALLSWRPIRQTVITHPAFAFVKRILPPVSKTEQEAIDAGTIGFDAELFSGRPTGPSCAPSIQSF